MHHMYPLAKGDPLCPLGFHPQVRWPTRCKRCFRDYKEHGAKKDLRLRKDETTVSSPTLSSWSSTPSRREESRSGSTDNDVSPRSWATSSYSSTATSSVAKPDEKPRASAESQLSSSKFSSTRPASSWTSTPDLGKLTEDTQADITTVSLTLPRRRAAPIEPVQETIETHTIPRRKVIERSPPRDRTTSASVPSTSTTSTFTTRKAREAKEAKEAAEKDAATTKLRRVQIQSLKEVKSTDKDDSEVEFVLQVKSSKTSSKPAPKPPAATKKSTPSTLSVPSTGSSSSSGTSSEESYEDDSDDDATSIAGTETTETDTLIDRNENELQEQIDSLKQELDAMRTKCERVEREKSDILLRRLAAMDTTPSKTAASEVLKLQQRVNEFIAQTEDLKDEKKVLTLRVKELEEELEQRPDATATKKVVDELRSKLLAAETLCEELMDENEDMKKELRDLEEEIEEMQDNFREDQADEYTTLRKELEQTAKNCRILSFKLRKAERKIEQVEAEKQDAEKRVGGGPGLERMKQLEQELAVANEVAKRLQKELEESNEKVKTKDDSGKKKPPMLGVIGKTSSGEKISRESLTRGGSQEDPVQLLRDLQDSMEREADLREQLRYAEEEAQTLRKKSSRVEDDNESLVLQLKKMATKARSRRHSPSPARLTPEPPVDKDEGISDEEDPAELRLLLELNEQEASVLRRKVEDMEKEGDIMKRKMKDLQDKLNVKTTRKGFSLPTSGSDSGKSSPLQDQKLKVMEEELSEVRKKLIEKDRDCERLNAELTLTQKRSSKGAMTKSKSLDLGNEQQALDLKRQLQVIEQEASILRSRTQTLEADNEKISAENKRLQMYRGPKKLSALKESGETAGASKELQEKVKALELQLTEATNKVNELKGKLEEQENELNDPKKKGLGLKETVELTKLKKEVKAKTEELDKMKVQATKQEGEFEKVNEVLKRLKEDSVANVVKFYKARTPKKPTDFTTKLQMKKMVEDLESEIAEVLVVLKKTEAEKGKLETDVKPVQDGAENLVLKAAKEKIEQDLEASKKTLEDLTKELRDEREKAEKERKKAIKDKKLVEENAKKLEENSRKMDEEKAKWEAKVKKIEEEKSKVEAEKLKIVEEVNQLKYDKVKMGLDMEKISAEKAAAVTKQDEVPVYIHKIECLKNDLEEERRQGASFRKQIETLQKAEIERNKLQKDMTEKTKKLADLEKQLKDTEMKAKKFEATTTSNKTKISGLEKQLAEEREKTKVNEEMSTNWLSERDKLKEKIEELQSKAKTVEADLLSKSNQIQTLEASVREERERATDASVKAGSAEKREITKLREELDTSNSQVRELNEKLDKIEKSSKAIEEKYKKIETDMNKTNNDLESKASELEMDLQAERKKSERIKATQEKETKNKEQELSSLKAKLRALETSSASCKKANDVQKEYEANIEKLEAQLSVERHAYEDLTSKYEILEEEHVVTKAQLVMDKEAIQKQMQSAKREHVSTENDLRALRETYNDKQDTWIKEKLDLQERLKELEERGSRNDENAATRLKNMVESKTSEVEKLKKESEVLSDQMDYLRKENDELKRKLEDFDKVVKIHRNMTADTSAIDKELQETKNKLFQEEKSKKAEVAQLKLRYDGRVALISEEIQSLQAQVSRFKRERDTFRHMLEGAQKTISDLKASPGKGKDNRTSTSSNDESEETRTKLATLDQQISCMEDELSEARLEASKLKTELVSERSSWEVKMSEMQSRVNELEEERIVASGRSKIPGMRTRMELAWQKEREEQHRLLQETSTLARDLRQTLFEVERERDKERLEAKRRHDQLKKTTEEEQDENRKKVTEIQCDLLELRDAHAKLRTTNEKLRREKERNEKDREELRQLVAGKKRAEADEERKVNTMLEQIDELMRLAPDLFPQKQDAAANIATPTPPRRLKGPKSRESSPSLERKEFKKESSVDRQYQLQSTVQRLADATEELRKYQRLSEDERDKERARRTIGMRRAASTESDNPPENTLRPKALNGKGVQRKGSLYRKSLSLEQTSGSAPPDQQIWKNDDETDGSLTSLQSAGSEAMMDTRYFSLQRREASVDSRLSGGSTQSDVLQSGEKKKKKGILGKLKKLTKSRSIDDTNTTTDYPLSVGQGSGSDISVAAEEKGSKKDLRDRLTGIFKKSGSRSSSVERSKKEESPALPDRTTLSTQRPLIRSATATSAAATTSSNAIQRPSPARSDSSQTSSSSRPLAPKKTIGAPLPTPSSTLRRTK